MEAEPAESSSSVTLLHLASRQQFFLLLKSSVRRHVQIVKVDKRTGALHFTHTFGRDQFPKAAQALEHLAHEGQLEVVASGKHVLGYVVIGSTGLLLLAEKVRVAATLPGNHQVKTVVTSRWLKIPLQAHQQSATSPASGQLGADGGGGSAAAEPPTASGAAQRDEYIRGVDKVTSFPIDGAHFFCETLDLTRPFPSLKPISQPSWEFVWNRWLSASFRSVGLDFLCPALLQGLCEERQLKDFDGAPYNVALISRRGRLHVGPRYKARGLNDWAEPANEIEVEQVVWRRQQPSPGPTAPSGTDATPAISWSRYTWRRGSVPLWWGVHMKNNGLGEAEIKIREQRTYQGSRRYVRRLQKRYCPLPWLEPGDATDAAGAASPSHSHHHHQPNHAPHHQQLADSSPMALSSSGTPRQRHAALDPERSAGGTPRVAADNGGDGAGNIGNISTQQHHRHQQQRQHQQQHRRPSDPTLSVPLVFVSLLRKGTLEKDRSETKLAAAYDYVCNALKKEHRIPLHYIALDWHELDKQLGSHELVSAFWSTLRDIMPEHRFALGTLTKVGQDHQDLARAGMEPPPSEDNRSPDVSGGGGAAAAGAGPAGPAGGAGAEWGAGERCTSPAGLGWQARWFKQQVGVVRYNCADSLDRTNVGSFFGAIQVLVEQCRELDIAIAVGPRGVGSIVTAIKRQQQQLQQAAGCANPGYPSLRVSSSTNMPVGGAVGNGNGNSSAAGGPVGSAGGTALSTNGSRLPGARSSLASDVTGNGGGGGAGASQQAQPSTGGMQGIKQGLDNLFTGRLFQASPKPSPEPSGHAPAARRRERDLSTTSAPMHTSQLSGSFSTASGRSPSAAAAAGNSPMAAGGSPHHRPQRSAQALLSVSPTRQQHLPRHLQPGARSESPLGHRHAAPQQHHQGHHLQQQHKEGMKQQQRMQQQEQDQGPLQPVTPAASASRGPPQQGSRDSPAALPAQPAAVPAALPPRPASPPAYSAPGALDEIARSLPAGWEVKVDNATDRIFYVDHTTRTTHWSHPSLSDEAVEHLARAGATQHLASMAAQADALQVSASASPAAPAGMARPSLGPAVGSPAMATGGGSDVAVSGNPVLGVTGVRTGAVSGRAAGTAASGMGAGTAGGMGPGTPVSSSGVAGLLGTPSGAAGLLSTPPAGARASPHQGRDADLAATTERLRLAEEEREMCEPLSPWCMLRSSAKAFARRIHPEALSAMAELFLVSGDMSAWLYTGSQAMHSERILLFEPETSKLHRAGVGGYGNIMVGIKRRYNNVMMDADRQQQVEAFLGLKPHVYFGSARLYYKDDGRVPLDADPETEDDEEPVGQLDWVPSDRSAHGGGYAGAAMLGGAGASDGTQAPSSGGSGRSRRKSYSSYDLLWERSLGFTKNSVQQASRAAGGVLAHVGGLVGGVAGNTGAALTAALAGVGTGVTLGLGATPLQQLNHQPGHGAMHHPHPHPHPHSHHHHQGHSVSLHGAGEGARAGHGAPGGMMMVGGEGEVEMDVGAMHKAVSDPAMTHVVSVDASPEASEASSSHTSAGVLVSGPHALFCATSTLTPAPSAGAGRSASNSGTFAAGDSSGHLYGGPSSANLTGVGNSSSQVAYLTGGNSSSQVMAGGEVGPAGFHRGPSNGGYDGGDADGNGGRYHRGPGFCVGGVSGGAGAMRSPSTSGAVPSLLQPSLSMTRSVSLGNLLGLSSPPSRASGGGNGMLPKEGAQGTGSYNAGMPVASLGVVGPARVGSGNGGGMPPSPWHAQQAQRAQLGGVVKGGAASQLQGATEMVAGRATEGLSGASAGLAGLPSSSSSLVLRPQVSEATAAVLPSPRLLAPTPAPLPPPQPRALARSSQPSLLAGGWSGNNHGGVSSTPVAAKVGGMRHSASSGGLSLLAQQRDEGGASGGGAGQQGAGGGGGGSGLLKLKQGLKRLVDPLQSLL